MNLTQTQPSQTVSTSLQNQQWQSFCSEIKKTMTGTDEEKDNILRRRILKFFHNFSLQRNRYYVNRREIMPQNYSNLQTSNNSILLYGIDFLPQPKIEQYFYPYQVSIQYYDESHCSVSFQNYQNLMKAIYKRLQNSIYQNYQQFYAILTSDQQKKLQWRQLVPYYQLCFERLVWFRFLTSSDYQNKSQLGQTTTYKTYLIAKDMFFKDIRKAREANLDNTIQRNRTNSRQQSFSRSRSRDKQRNSRKMQQVYSSKREGRDKYSHLSRQCQLCNCCIFKEVQKIISQIQNKTCCKKTNKARKRYEQIEQEPQNHNLNTQKAAYFNRANYQKKYENIPVSRLSRENRQKEVSTKLFNKIGKSLQRTKQDNLDQEADLTFNSLVKDLQRYNFDDQPSQFEDFISPVKAQRNHTLTSINEKEGENIDIEDYSVFEMIEEQ